MIHSQALHAPTHTLAFADQEVRFAIHAAQSWFSAYDVARCLGLKNEKGSAVRHRLRKLPAADIRRVRMRTPGGLQPILAVSLRGLRALADMKDTDQDQAFRAWLANELEPAADHALAMASPAEMRPDLSAPEALFTLPATIASALRRLADDIEAREAPAARLAAVRQLLPEVSHTPVLEI